MSDDCVIERDEFSLDNLRLEWVADIRFFLHRIHRLKGKSAYLVYAYPHNAKLKTSRDGVLTERWPEVFLGVLESEAGGVGKAKLWDIHPVLVNGLDWTVKPVDRVHGREMAASRMLIWIMERNRKRQERGKQKKQAKQSASATVKRLAANWMFDAYMFTFDNFSTDTKEVAEQITDGQLESARHIGGLLEEVGLIIREKTETRGGVRISGQGITRSRGDSKRFEADTWQCWDTYDDISRAKAIDLFIEKLPSVANRIKDVIANEMKRSRNEISS